MGFAKLSAAGILECVRRFRLGLPHGSWHESYVVEANQECLAIGSNLDLRDGAVIDAHAVPSVDVDAEDPTNQSANQVPMCYKEQDLVTPGAEVLLNRSIELPACGTTCRPSQLEPTGD